MTIEAIAAIETASSTEIVPLATMARSDFSVALGGGVQAVDSALKTADQQVRVLASGQEIVPHDVMISLEEARMHLMLLSEVRNRVVEAYQELSRMQV